MLDSGSQLVTAIESGDWAQGAMAGVGVALDTAATVIDPLGSLIAAGLGWLIDHLEPLKGWFNDFTGDAGEVAAFGQTWANVQSQLQTSGDELARIVGDVDELAGEAMDAYRRFQSESAQHISAAASWAGAMSTGLQIASTIVQIVHDLVRDVLSQLVGSIISWAAEAVFTLGLATPVIVGQVTTRVASLSAKVGKYVTDAISSCKSLSKLLDELTALLREAGTLFDGVLKGGGPSGRGPHGPLRSESPPTPARSPDGPPTFRTAIDDNVVDVPRQDLPPGLASTFTDGQYRTVETIEPVELYRVYGGDASQTGGFATTEYATDRLTAMDRSALNPEWNNTREWQAVIDVPAGQTLQIGQVAPQVLDDGRILPGGADQILLPQNWDPSWIRNVEPVPPIGDTR
ncbi:hypothetical protein [Microbacterium sp. cx-59]|uniref:hypothetical protein n=1 Tax=Microbacterium sp. cx-59 TaxID=2891207 RepID=UPI001E472EBC|nr:hypothetical protein [Microbacterium sp. cx-59]MCC4909339.1 hypothetical protein [Microbacterium sp. cx-59]